MKTSIRKLLDWVCIVAAVAAVACLCGPAAAQDDQQGVKIQPYTGPPIFLDEREQVAEPTIVDRDKIEEKDDATGKVRIEREVVKFSDNHYEADGAYREFYPNGQVFVEGQYRRGRRDGEWIYYYEDGTINRKSQYKDGLPEGTRDIYRDDGSLWAKRGFKGGVRDGEWITYDKTGKQPLREEHYANGKPEGVWKIWFPNGKLRQEFGIKEGQRDGKYTEWDDKGEKRAELNYAAGKLHGTATRWFPDGRVIVQEYNDGKLESQKSG